MRTGRAIAFYCELIRAGALGVMAFVFGEKTLWLTPAQAKAKNLPLQSLKPEQAKAVDRLGDLIVPGAAPFPVPEQRKARPARQFTDNRPSPISVACRAAS